MLCSMRFSICGARAGAVRGVSTASRGMGPSNCSWIETQCFDPLFPAAAVPILPLQPVTLPKARPGLAAAAAWGLLGPGAQGLTSLDWSSSFRRCALSDSTARSTSVMSPLGMGRGRASARCRGAPARDRAGRRARARMRAARRSAAAAASGAAPQRLASCSRLVVGRVVREYVPHCCSSSSESPTLSFWVVRSRCKTAWSEQGCYGELQLNIWSL